MTVAVAVVGGGAVGATVAHDLAARGAAVTLFEADEIGSGSTGRAAGVCYDAFTDAANARLGDRAIDRFRALSGRAQFRFHGTEYVWLATEEGRKADAVREGVERMQAHDRDVALADPGDLRDRFPAVDWDDAVVAAVARDAGCTDPGSYARLLAAMARDEGATVREGEAVAVRADPPQVADREFDAVVVAAGAHTPGLLGDAGVPVPVKPYRVQALVTPGPAVPMVYDATDGYYLRPHPDGVLAGDGTEPVEADPDSYDPAGDDWFVAEMESRLADRLVEFDPAVDRAWAGLCTATPDGRPLVGELRDDLYVATGWQGHGFMRSPAVGEALAEQVLGGDGIPGFEPGRFDGDEEFEIVEGMAL